MNIALSINLNKIALIRNARPGDYPSVVSFGRRVLELGAQGITVHPRPDQRHIRPGDVAQLGALRDEFPGTELNIEGNPFAPARGSYPGLLELVESNRPQQCTLVPDSDDQATSDHGFDLSRDGERLRPILATLHGWGVRTSLFMDPDPRQIELAAALGVHRIELYTGPFAAACSKQPETAQLALAPYAAAAEAAQTLGVGVNAGHDLNLDNLTVFSSIPPLLEVSIGHAFTVDCLLMGVERAMQAYLALCRRP